MVVEVAGLHGAVGLGVAVGRVVAHGDFAALADGPVQVYEGLLMGGRGVGGRLEGVILRRAFPIEGLFGDGFDLHELALVVDEAHLEVGRTRTSCPKSLTLTEHSQMEFFL